MKNMISLLNYELLETCTGIIIGEMSEYIKEEMKRDQNSPLPTFEAVDLVSYLLANFLLYTAYNILSSMKHATLRVITFSPTTLTYLSKGELDEN